MAKLFHEKTSRSEFADLYILLGESLYQNDRPAEALRLFKEVAGLEEIRADASVSLFFYILLLDHCS